ncbi:MAG: SUMF1/EgtB/PvdO family nonheme iron enzyme [Myxococcales bacterium]|nr:SUMF1/EgtB/PvdO family nonheme iron enzyme [Myxococcales bacterium]
MPRRSLLSLCSLLLPLPSCSGPTSHEYDLVDTPQPTPIEVPEPPRPEEDDPATEPEGPGDCGRGTGRNASGECEQLHTRELEHGLQVQLPAGRFLMGDVPRSYAAELSRHDPRELWPGQPPRYAESGAFWLDLHEVTRGAYEACVEAGNCTPAVCPEDEADPVEKFSPEAAARVPQTCVSHEQAAAYCAANGGRLPTEVEWEYAARGVDARIYPWGNDMRDEYMAMLMAVGSVPADSSYFGILGMGTNAIEWVADDYEIDNGLQGYLARPFRDPDGPLLTAEAARGQRFVMKGGKTGARRDKIGPDKRVGFRCAADLGPDEAPLTVPTDPPPITVARPVGSGLLMFGGVAEAVSRKEAEQFCAALRIEVRGEPREGWRLPTLAEIEAIADMFRGPGPFWTADGAAVQGGSKRPDDPWQAEEAEPGEPLAARCVLDEPS